MSLDRCGSGSNPKVSASLEDLRQETEKKREAFMQLLAQRYPQYADKIQGVEAEAAVQALQQERPSRSREVQRRRTAVVTYNPGQAVNTLEYDDLGTMSDLELPSFQRGGFMRTSLPIVRSASTSLERPLGLVFLVYGDQTKKSMLPNEITTLDTVRALFVRAFPDLTLDILEDPRKKIYLLDPATNIYFQLEDLMDIKDRSVLKIHETDSDQPQKVREKQEVRGRTVQMPVSRPHSRQIYGELPLATDVYTKPQPHPPPPLQPQTGHSYPEMMQEQRNLWEMDRRSRSRTPEYAERPRSLSAGASSSRQRFSHSPDRLPTPERAPLNPIPENRQLPPGYQDQSNYYETVGPGPYRGQYLSGIYESPAVYQSFPPPSPIPNQQTYIAHSTRAPSLAHPQRAVTPAVDLTQAAQLDGGLQHPQNYCLPPTDRDAVESSSGAPHAEDMTTNRIDKMEQQLASLTAWVHYQKDGTRKESTPVPRSSGSLTSDGSGTCPASSASSLSDICGYQRSSGLSSRESTPVSVQVEVSARMAQLRSDLHVLRRQQQLNMEAMRDEFLAAYTKIKKVLHSIPGSQNQMIFHKRNEATLARSSYIQDKHQTDKEISDLEASVEELRADVISRQCRVNASDVEAMALLLSNITKSLADLKTRFPELQNLMKHVMDAELRVVVSEEKFLKEEPTEIEQYLKRCKKITGTLYTLKRLASVQDHRPPQVPSMALPVEASLSDQKKALLENIRSLVPDHEQRMKEMEAADASRERKKKISSQQEALKFGKSLEIASRNLRPPSFSDDYQPKESELDDGYIEEHGQSSVAPTQHTTSTAIHSMPSSAIISSMTLSSTAPSSSKSSFSTSVAAAIKPIDKPTATVSAMTAGVSETVTVMTSGRADKELGTHTTKTTGLSLIQATEHQDLSVTKTLTHSVQVGTDSPQKKDATVYAYQTNSSINPVFPVSHPVFDKHENFDNNAGKIPVKPTYISTDSNISTINKPSDLPLYKPGIPKAGSSLDSATTYGDIVSASNTSTGSPDSKDKAEFTSQKHAARSAFFSSMNTPPDSPSTTPPIRNSHDLDRVHSSSTSGVKPTQSFFVNQDSSSAVSTRSSIGLESFTNTSSSSDATSVQPAENRSSSVIINSPTRGIPRHAPEHKSSSSSSSDAHSGIPRHAPEHKSSSSTSSSSDTHSNSDAGSKQKKVPPPPPPRKGSRPTSANMSPVHSGPLDSPEHQSKDIQHRFAGGMLGHHRLSGGPLFSTPKPLIQQKASRFEQDIASGIYANMNRPDIQNQNTSPQEIITQANMLNNKKPKNQPQTISPPNNPSIPPPPSVTIALDREERASSSESSSSSSGTSMGSQQSVVSVIKSPTASDKSSSKPKPDPPKRQSSLLAKFTGSKDSKSKVKNGKAKGSGVDL